MREQKSHPARAEDEAAHTRSPAGSNSTRTRHAESTATPVGSNGAGGDTALMGDEHAGSNTALAGDDPAETAPAQPVLSHSEELRRGDKTGGL
jgi:hypothetical protein